jgi:hypothetical protein
MIMDEMPLYPDEAAIAAAVLGTKRAKEWPRIAVHLEAKHGLPPVDAEMGGRFWPAVKQYFYSRHEINLTALCMRRVRAVSALCRSRRKAEATAIHRLTVGGRRLRNCRNGERRPARIRRPWTGRFVARGPFRGSSF